ncbi:DUF421 domain-containing protein [Clostridium grantii]|uniref:Uncharacterized membrane protein YcaP, DUF421 family n=1 Tax=Clostridium grantii DSM 8605 TaxID=1121316 RepID=A0A1M5RSD3_9CLOT|nr:DUF421 domain-containing protein [Clostridium grantii]SHH29252.1 Uncharacterized membrane protein YcaP, DUF421 family [Clostridium grantii DSM 8605]
MFTVLFRTIILYFVVVFTMRLMGKRQIGQLQPFELVIAIMISDLASVPMQDLKVPILYGIIPILTLLFLQTIITILQLKSESFRKIVSGSPSLIIRHGKLDICELKKQKLTFDDLMEELRLKGIYNINDIEFAIFETSGQLSIIPKTELIPVTRRDLNIHIAQDFLPITLILDGKINKSNLEIIHKDDEWLKNQLKENKIMDINNVFIGVLDTKNRFFFQLKQNKKGDVV